MYFHLIPVPIVLFGIVVYWRARWKGDLARVRLVQPALTALIMLVALAGFFTPGGRLDYTLWILGGLAVALAGDFNNIDMSDRRVLIRGLVLFVIAYLIYATGLTALGGFHAGDLYTGAVLLLAYLAVMAYLWQGLGDLRLPVLVYGLVLPILVWRAAGTFFSESFSFWQSALVSAGATMLYLGDLEFAVSRFRKPIRQYGGPVLYAGGQLCIALSTAYFDAPCPEWLERTCQQMRPLLPGA